MQALKLFLAVLNTTSLAGKAINGFKRLYVHK